MWNMGGSLRRGDVLRHSSVSCSVVVGGGAADTAVVTTAVSGGTADGCGGGGADGIDCRDDGPTTSSVGRSIGDHIPDCQQKSNDLLFCLRSTQSRRRRSARLVPEAAAWLRYQVRGSRWVALRPSASHSTKTPSTNSMTVWLSGSGNHNTSPERVPSRTFL